MSILSNNSYPIRNNSSVGIHQIYPRILQNVEKNAKKIRDLRNNKVNTKIKEKKHTESLNDQPNIKSTNVSAAVMTNVVIKNEIKEKNQEHTNENDDNTETNSTIIEPQPSSSDNNQINY